MNTLLKILKTEREFEPLFELVEFDPRTNEIKEKLSEYHKLGVMVDVYSDSWVGLKTGKYELVKKKFDEFVGKIRNSNDPRLADNIRLYDISKMSAENVEKLLTHSGILKTLIDGKDYSYEQGNAFDDYVLVED